MIIITVIALLAEWLITAARTTAHVVATAVHQPGRRHLTPHHHKENSHEEQHPRIAATLAAAVLAASTAACGRTSSTGSDNGDDAAGTPKVKIMVGGIDKVIYLPAMLTERLGYFKDAGVDVAPEDRAVRRAPPRTCSSPARCRAWSASTTTPSTCRPRASASRASSSSPRCRARSRSSRPSRPASVAGADDFTGKKLGRHQHRARRPTSSRSTSPTKNGIDSDEVHDRDGRRRARPSSPPCRTAGSTPA